MSAAEAIQKIKDRHGDDAVWMAIEELARQIDKVEKEGPKRAAEDFGWNVR